MVNAVQAQPAQASPGSPWLPAQLPAGTGTAALCPVASAKLSPEKGAALPCLQQLLGRKQVLGNMAAAVFSCESRCGWAGGWQGELPFPARLAPGAREQLR